MSRNLIRIVAFAAGISILAACSSPAAPSGPVTVDATLNAAPGSEVAVAAIYLMYDMSVMSTAASTVISPEPGVYLGPASPIDADGTVHLVLPDPADLPAGVLGTAESFVWAPSSPRTLCPTTASLPSARVSSSASLGATSIPTAAVLTGGGLQESYVSDKKVDFSANEEQFFQMKFITWLYADNDVDIETNAGGCTGSAGPTVFVDLELKKGWNQVAWTLKEDTSVPGTASSITLGNAADIDTVYISYSATSST